MLQGSLGRQVLNSSLSYKMDVGTNGLLNQYRSLVALETLLSQVLLSKKTLSFLKCFIDFLEGREDQVSLLRLKERVSDGEGFLYHLQEINFLSFSAVCWTSVLSRTAWLTSSTVECGQNWLVRVSSTSSTLTVLLSCQQNNVVYEFQFASTTDLNHKT